MFPFDPNQPSSPTVIGPNTGNMGDAQSGADEETKVREETSSVSVAEEEFKTRN